MMESKKLMDACYETQQAFLAEDKYQQANGAGLVESLVNNVHHGKPIEEWLPQAARAGQSVLDGDNLFPEMKEGYAEAYKHVTALMEAHGFTQ